MSSGNRVEELESRVRELEATVSGLTDELVESRERLHAIEDEVDVDQDIIEGRPTRSEASEEGSADAEFSPDEQEPEDADAESSDEIIVA